MDDFVKKHKEILALPAKRRDVTKTEVYKIYKETGIVDYWPIVNELAKRTHLPKWIVRKVYEAHGDILYDLGIID